MLCAPLFQRSLQRGEQRDTALVGAVKCPAYFGQRQRTGVDEVVTLPTRLEFLLEVEERAILARIAEMLCQEINTVAQEGVIGAIDITERRQAEAHDFGSLHPQVFDGAGQ